jgi:hypothetical protein
MKRRNFFFVLMGNLAWVLLPGCGRNSGADGKAGADAPTEGNEVRAYEEANREQLEAATQREKMQQRLAEAVAHTKDYREQLQYTCGDAWAKYVSQNMKLFMSLRQQAARSPSQAAPCTICNGRGQASFCVLCKDTGKCPTCGGTGALSTGAMCPTCQGRKVCYLCHGSGKMTCAFCNDGSVAVDQSTPPDKMPIG